MIHNERAGRYCNIVTFVKIDCPGGAPVFFPAREHSKRKEEPCFRLLFVYLFGYFLRGIPCPVGRAAVALRTREIHEQHADVRRVDAADAARLPDG